MLLKVLKSFVHFHRFTGGLVVVAALFFLIILPTGFENRIENIQHVKGVVQSVDNSLVRQFGLVKNGEQVLNVLILEGKLKGRVVEATNLLIGKMELDSIYSEGEKILVDISTDGTGAVRGHASGPYRLGLEMWLFILFSASLALFAGWTGVQAILSFVFSALLIWKVMLPLFLKGYEPISVAFGCVTIMTTVILFMIGGLSKKGLVALLGSMLGLGLTCLLALFLAKPFHIHGAVRPFAETLLYSGFAHLDLTALLVSGVFIAASGAVMDLSMDIATALQQIALSREHVTRNYLLRSGREVGKAVIGTMTTTLLFAYSGSYLTMLMYFMSQGIPISVILNSNYVAAEFLHTMVGSFGLVSVAPFTILVGAFAYGRDENRS
ncbi:MAG: YibE/F family protein [Thermovirga sp.]